MISLHETCQEYFNRRLSEGWKCISLEGYNAVLLSPGGVRREIDLRNDVETLRPSAIGDEESIDHATSGAGFHHNDVDEAGVGGDGDTTVVYDSGSTPERDLYNIPASSGSGAISKITVFFCCRSDTYGVAKASIKSDTTVTDGGFEYIGYTYVTYSKEWATNPAPPGTDAWTWDDIDALQIGVKVGGDDSRAYCYCTQVYVEVDYTPAAAVLENESANMGSKMVAAGLI